MFIGRCSGHPRTTHTSPRTERFEALKGFANRASILAEAEESYESTCSTLQDATAKRAPTVSAPLRTASGGCVHRLVISDFLGIDHVSFVVMNRFMDESRYATQWRH